MISITMRIRNQPYVEFLIASTKFVAIFIVLFSFLGAAANAQDDEWAIPDPYPIQSDILAGLFLLSNESLSPDSLRYAHYTDYSLSCYAQFYKRALKSKQLMMISEALIDTWNEMKKLGGAYDKALYTEKEQGLIELRASLKANKEILNSFVPHIDFGLKNLAKLHPEALISSAANKDYAELRKLYFADPRRSALPLCPDSLQQPVPGKHSMKLRSQIVYAAIEEKYEACTSSSKTVDRQASCNQVVKSTIARERQKARAWTELAEIFIAEGNELDAGKAFEKSLELEPDNYWTYVKRGRIYDKTDQFLKAIQDFSKAWDLRPDSERTQATILYYRYISYLQNGDLENAGEDKQNALKIYPKMANRFKRAEKVYTK